MSTEQMRSMLQARVEELVKKARDHAAINKWLAGNEARMARRVKKAKARAKAKAGSQAKAEAKKAKGKKVKGKKANGKKAKGKNKRARNASDEEVCAAALPLRASDATRNATLVHKRINEEEV